MNRKLTAPYQNVRRDDGSVVNVANGYNDDGSLNVTTFGGSLVESKTQDDAVDGVVTFSAPVSVIEIYTLDKENDAVFIVNGTSINIPAGAPPFIARIAGEPSAEVTVSGATSYVLNRYE